MLRRDRPGEGLTTAGHVAAPLLGKLRDRERTGAPRGRATGLRCVDGLLSGLMGGQVIVVAGRPSMGKTSFATELVLRLVGDMKSVGAFFSLETTRETLTSRLLGQLSNLPTRRINAATLTAEEWEILEGSVRCLEQMKLFIDDGSVQTESSILSRCRQLAQQEGRLDVVAIDYLQLMRPAQTRKQHNKNDEVAEISRGLKILAKDLNVPVLLLSQLNREVDKRPDPRPNMSDLRDSGAIEQDADVIVFPFRPAVYSPKADARDVEIIVAKQKDGPIGTANAIWDPESMCFDDPS
jgi:replicative DNA helicase